MEPKETIFLVLVRVTLLGGKEAVAVDAFKVEDATTALNYARNMFIQSRGEAVVYGTTSFLVDMVTSVEAEVLAVLDETHPFNAPWLESIEMFEDFWEKEEQKVRADNR